MPRRILVPLDGSDVAEGALPAALEIANRTAGDLRVVRVHVPVMPITTLGDYGPPFYSPEWDKQARIAERDYVQRVIARVSGAVKGRVDSVLPDGNSVADALETAADDFDADLIVMTTHGHGGTALAWLGSVADSVIRTCRRPTLVIPEKAAGRPLALRTMLVALDGSAQANVALDSSLALARAFGAVVRLVRVVAPPLVGDVLTALSTDGIDHFGIDRVAEVAKTELDATAKRVRDAGFDAHAAVVVHANPARAILEYAEEVHPDLLVATTSGRGMSRVFVGSVADKVLRSSGLPMLVQRPPDADAE